MLAYLEEHRIVAPSYSFLQDLVGRVLTFEQNRLMAQTRQLLTPDNQEVLRSLLEDVPGLAELTRLKREPKDFSVGEIKREIQRGDRIRS